MSEPTEAKQVPRGLLRPAELLEHSMAENVESDNTIKNVSKELFSHLNVDTKTEVSDEEIILLTKLRFLRDRYHIKNVDGIIQSFLTLRISKGRKSRDEVIKALQAEGQHQQAGFFSKMFGGAT